MSFALRSIGTAWPRRQVERVCISRDNFPGLMNMTMRMTNDVCNTKSNHMVRRFMGHTVRVIAIDDWNDGKGYKNDVLNVKAGYARNYLIPQKKAVYATRENFTKYDVLDPLLEQKKQVQEKAVVARSEKDDVELRQADILTSYLRKKVLKIWRNFDPVTQTMHPGMVNAKAVRDKLSKQLRIDLDPDEKVHIRAETLIDLIASKTKPIEEEGGRPLDQESILEALVQEMGPVDESCNVEIRQQGEYLARISLSGGYTVPLRFEILKR